jgi:hypothetical protein
MVDPTDAGKIRWPDTGGYLELVAKTRRDPEKLPCTCVDACAEPDCRGACGCEACALAWLVYHDDHALWDNDGNLVTPPEISGAWHAIKNPRSIYQRCQSSLKINR